MTVKYLTFLRAQQEALPALDSRVEALGAIPTESEANGHGHMRKA